MLHAQCVHIGHDDHDSRQQPCTWGDLPVDFRLRWPSFTLNHCVYEVLRDVLTMMGHIAHEPQQVWPAGRVKLLEVVHVLYQAWVNAEGLAPVVVPLDFNKLLLQLSWQPSTCLCCIALTQVFCKEALTNEQVRAVYELKVIGCVQAQ